MTDTSLLEAFAMYAKTHEGAGDGLGLGDGEGHATVAIKFPNELGALPTDTMVTD